MKTIYDFNVKTLQGKILSFNDYHGGVFLIVNTASKCGLTPQYKELEHLYQTYKDQGLHVFGFPCNQFGGQEHDNNEAIQSTCEINYGVTFNMMEKIEVNGASAHPLYKWLKSKKSGVFGSKIKWNFTKFLVNPEGKVVARFAPVTKAPKIEKAIKKLLASK